MNLNFVISLNLKFLFHSLLIRIICLVWFQGLTIELSFSLAIDLKCDLHCYYGY